MTFDISWATLWRIFFFVALIAMLYAAKDVIIVLFLAIILSAALDAPVSALEKRKIPRILSAIFIFAAAFAVFTVLLYAITPLAVFETRAFLSQLAQLNVPAIGPIDTSRVIGSFSNDLRDVSGIIGQGGSLINLIFVVFGNVVLVIAAAVLAFYLTLDREGVEKFLRAILPPFEENRAIEMYHRIRRRFGLWLQGQILIMLVLGLVVFVGLWFLGVPYALVLGILAALLEIIPVVGPVFTGLLAFLAALSVSFPLGIYTILFFVAVQQIENHLLVPVVMRKTVGVNPVVVVIALLLGAQIAGFTGILLAVPAVVIFDEILEVWGAEKARRRAYRLEA
ncbi:AI-2E family transporter [Candidatus Wolfebacteria bacterium]|nr:AI-2E family transporter [Candidatus Wolfebacteria bacterium]